MIENWEDCTRCHGTGRIIQMIEGSIGRGMGMFRYSFCCDTCSGRGIVRKARR